MGQRKTVLQASRTAMHLHTWAGLGLLGFALWHIYLYQPSKQTGRRTESRAGAAK